jgi:hypothetical protein
VLFFEQIEGPRVSQIFSHSGGSWAPWVTKDSRPIIGYIGATSTTTKEKSRPIRVFWSDWSQEIVPDQHLEETTILDFEEKALGPPETLTTDLLTPIIVLIHPYECQTMYHAAMETNDVTPSRNSSIPTTVVTIEEFPPTNPPSPV